jgi:hypothetical protein
MLKLRTKVERVKGLHVPFINEYLGKGKPRFMAVLDSRIRFALQRRVPMPRGEGAVVLNDRDQLGPNVRLEEVSGHLSMTYVSEDLADVMTQGR